MNTQRLGCLSPLALFSTFITLVILVVAEVNSGNSMFSPGALNAQAGQPLGGVTSHAALGKACGQCHAPFWASQRMSDLCLACHVAVQGELGDPSSLHGTLLRGQPLSCQACHREHRGPEASLTVLETANFPHTATGFALTGHQTRSAGLPFTCRDCHSESFSAFNQQICLDCHRTLDETYAAGHLQAFGEACLACHDGVDRYGAFDHSQTPFALTGEHLRVDCSGCHLQARTSVDLQQTATACETCHLADDAHNGEFGAQCGVCHRAEGWKPATFDHSLAAFPLEGQHAEVACESCHTSGYQGTPQTCYACHKEEDEHAGKYGTVCETCHNPSDWEAATFDHSLAAFPLDGAHLKVECAECHQDEIFKGTPGECAACHLDPVFHAGLFPGQACADCHTTAAWRPARYSGLHPFPMDHGEKNNACADCHQPNLTRWTCDTCHSPAEVEQEHREEGIFDFNDCLRCHPTGREEEGG